MSEQKYWLLPAGIEAELPDSALHIEKLRRKVLGLFDSWGYDFVIPPPLEYLESLLITSDENLNLQTLKLTDQLNGRMMGLRADMTPQVAWIDAHHFNHERTNRLCYTGTVIRARPIDISGARSMIQFGAEIYGHSGIESDMEIIRLMLTTLGEIGITHTQLGMGHVGVYFALVKAADLDTADESGLFDLVQMKAAHEIQTYLAARNVDSEHIDCFTRLVSLHGGPEILKRARRMFAGVQVEQALLELEAISSNLNALGITRPPYYDLADLGGYHYNSGVVFAAFSEYLGKEIARGGRYDNVGRIFGRERPATGFSSDLKQLAALVTDSYSRRHGVFAPQSDDSALSEEIAKLRQRGHRVVQQLHADETAQDCACDRILLLKAGRWQVEKL